MIVVSCPLRISLVGGSTDHPWFLEKYHSGAVISFPSTLRTYVTIHQDVFGTNTVEHNYNINYSRRETVKRVSDIQNELVRHCFEELNVEQMNCTLTSDIYSVGSGLAASSAYLQALIKSVYIWRGQHITENEVCKIAEHIERRFNPLVGQQDFYGSMGGFKRINFSHTAPPVFRYLNTGIVQNLDIYLLYTGILRNSTSVLESLDLTKSLELLKDVDDLEQAIEQNDLERFTEVMRRSWQHKKSTSKMICENPTLAELDQILETDTRVLSHKLCGAGNGGYFLLFTEKGTDLEQDYAMCKQIGISETGLKWVDLNHEFSRI